MRKLIYFKDGNGFIDIPNRIISRWIWNDDQPHAQWNTDWVWCWTATDLYGITDDEWEMVFVLSTPNPHARTVEQKTADELYWKKILGYKWFDRQQQIEELPKREQEYNIRI
jgi:hypothetical protein